MMNQIARQTNDDRQLRHLTQSERLEEAEDPILVKVSLVAISACIIAFVAWASITNVNEVARAPGEIVPQGFQQVVQTLDGGTVRAILAQEGQAAEKGQVLMILDGNGSSEDLARAQAKQVSLELQQERLRAFIDGRKPDFRRFEGQVDPKLIRDQEGIFAAAQDSNARQAAVIRDQIAQKQATMRTLQARQNTIAQNLSVSEDIYNRRKTLQDGGYVSHTSFLQSQKDVNDLRGESAGIQSQMGEARAALNEYGQRLGALGANARDDAYKQLEQVENDLALNTELVRKMQDAVARLEVKSPVRGLVKGLSVNTVGAVVQPGQTLMEIVPLDKPLVAEVKIPPSSIGHVHPGQAVQLKVSAYDFARYGALPGTLESISPSTFEGEHGERFYKGRVLLDRNYIGRNPGQFKLMPGMTVMADVVTGDKTIMDYLLKPIALNLKSAFTER
jgi:HlyD family secretion protein/adhesin transport system membrane fusion protein